jgi:nondiscriminating glutamyl-tRNA synthetase
VKTRVRFAPSPTGYLHVGGVRTLLFNWLYAKKTGGTLILRIEDTDLERSTDENTRLLLRAIQELGFDYSEGVMPDGKDSGPHGPYSQSQRVAIYAKHVRDLLERNLAYFAFDTEEQIQQKRELAIKLGAVPDYDGAKLSLADAEKRIAAGERPVVRFRAPHASVFIEDALRGKIEFKSGTVEDFVLTRSPRAGEEHLGSIGMPTYNFCCVIDDHLMEMTHVIRGEDHLTNTVKQQLIYEAFGWKAPVFAHIAMVLGADKQKLSKRNGDASAQDYLDKGYLIEAIMNFLALLGWWPKGNPKTASGHPEVLNTQELISLFDFDGLQKAPGVFDVQKLQWMNGFYIKQKPLKEICQLSRPFFDQASEDIRAKVAAHSPEWFEALVDTIRGECQLLSDFPKAAALFFEATPELEPEAKLVMEQPGFGALAAELKNQLSALPETLSAESVDALQKQVGAVTGAKGKGLFMPIRVAITGRTHGPEMKKVLPLLGKAEALKRIQSITGVH